MSTTPRTDAPQIIVELADLTKLDEDINGRIARGPVMDSVVRIRHAVDGTANEIADLKAADEAHRKAQAAIYTALGTGEPDRDKWPAQIADLKAKLARAQAALGCREHTLGNSNWIIRHRQAIREAEEQSNG